MIDWQITATTTYCGTVDDNITVYKDFSTRCTGYMRYRENLDKVTAKILAINVRNLAET